MPYSRIVGTGSYLPEKVLTNHDLEKMVDTTDQWIRERSGISRRHIAAPEQTCSELAQHASEHAIEASGIDRAEIDLVIVATSTPDMIFPSAASLLQARLGLRPCAAFDVQAVCSGFVYALSVADQYIRTGQYRCALVVGSEVFSRILDWTDRRTCVLFGDGAGAVIVKSSAEPGLLSTHLYCDGSLSRILCVPGSVSNGVATGHPFVVMEGPAVFKVAVKVLGQVAREALEANQLSPSALDWLIPHQANVRIIDATAEKLGLKPEQVVRTVVDHGNTSAASIPLALDRAVRDGRVQRGHHVLFEAVGGGMTWGAALLRW